MKKQMLLLLPLLALAGCADKPKQNDAMLEKYPYCYHKNTKISNKCISMNEAGQKTTALDLENAAYPGEYK